MVKNVLFVCNANLQRSPTGEEIVNNEKDFQEKEYIAKSAGISPLAETQITKSSIEWADIIFCMEEFQKQVILQNFSGIIKEKSKNKDFKILNLQISDRFERDDPELKKAIKEKIRKYLK